MSVLVPPRKERLRFWAFGLRQAPEYRPWVYEQVTSPGYAARRMRALLLLQLVCVVIPQGLFAIDEQSLVRAVLPASLLGMFAFFALRPPRMRPAQQQRMLAYHGLSPDGRFIEPVSPWAENPLGKAGLALLVAQVLVLASGIAVVYDRSISCDAVPAASLAALQEVIGMPDPGAVFGVRRTFPGQPDDPPAYDVEVGSRPLFARQVDTPLAGLHYVAAYVRDRHGRLLGPAIWRVIQPNTTFSLQTYDVAAADVTARRLTPSSGAEFSPRPTSLMGKARSCARWAN